MQLRRLFEVQVNAFFIAFRSRHYFRNMTSPDLNPPVSVRGMTVLDRKAFEKRISVPLLKVPRTINFNKVCIAVKKQMLKMERYKPVRSDEYKITLHPLAVKNWEDLKEANLHEKGLEHDSLVWEDIQLGYDNWRYDEVLKAVLPEDKEALSAFSQIGHVIHLNLKEHLIPYKKLIGEVIKDKVAGCRTVVNKLDTIDNTYRNFQMELLTGEDNFQVSVKENGTMFEFDFSKVYWNPRLATEHDKLVKMLSKQDILLDVYAGVGPFSIPAAKIGCNVLANDLNPDSYTALVHNCSKNKVETQVKCFNKNGINFIQDEVRDAIFVKNKDDSFKGTIHITMNLPALAVEHLDNYVGLLHGEPRNVTRFPLVHVYCFAKGDEDRKGIARKMVEENMGILLGDNLKEIAFVRNVSPNKDMMRISFYLTEEILFSTVPNPKRAHQEDDRKTVSRQISKMAKSNGKNRNQQKQIAKKAKSVFTVSQAKKNNVKKAKEVSVKLKKINVHDKREKADKNFRDLHAQIVSKKQNNKPASKPLPQKNKAPTTTKHVEAGLDKMQM